MNTKFTGKELKVLLKPKWVDHIVLRINGNNQTIEAASSIHDPVRNRTILEISTEIPLSEKNSVILFDYVKQYPTTIEYFITSLKPDDEVIFMRRSNGTQNTKEAGLIVTDIRAQITKRKKDGVTPLYRKEATVKTEITTA